ncbi:MAG TPA: adenylate/guanylate cyclase domain-containing protein, partial [Solirubrobacteraceae bacterium]|nr:adenylate/guanylate cyclase domain-containing protein [Solirubrobacteraceae bacterium]
MTLPVGTVTLLFTDIEGSTRLLDRLGDRYAGVLADHRRLLRDAFAAAGGAEVDTQGDAFFVAFARAGDAVRAAVAAQRALVAHPWPGGMAVRVRMGIHSGEPATTGDGYVGLDVHRGARICAAGHGGQVLVSGSTRALLGDRPGGGIAWRDLGDHRLKDLPAPERLFQLVVDGLPADFPPVKSLDDRPTNLPAQLTPLVGRRRELGELAAMLERDATRLVTLTGPGGSGKSRLSLEVAGEWRELHPGWVFAVELAPVADPGLAGPAIADALGLLADGGEPARETLLRGLAGQPVLLVLDNFEHLLPAAPLLAELLAGCPRLRVLVTSRAPLRLSGEHRYEVRPLPADDAVALFLERARAVRPGLALDDATRRPVTAICARLEGLPLAIELAAARSGLLPPPALLERLEAPLALLTAGARDRPERQQTMRATIDWSFRLLTGAERDALAALSVFAGGFALDAADAVAGASLDVLGALVDASLLRGSDRADGEPRFSMLETIREYGREQLAEAGRAAAVAARHARFFRDLVRDTVSEPWGPRIERGLAVVEREHDNVRAALGWAVEHDPVLAVELAGGLVWFWDTHGHLAEGRRWLDLALARGRDAPPAARARACFAVVRLACSQWQQTACLPAAEEALRLYRQLGDAAGVALTLSHVAMVREVAGDLDAAIATSQEALDVARTAPGDPWTLSVTLNNAAVELIPAGELDRARALLEESLALRRSMEDRRGIAVTLENLGEIALAEGDLERARTIAGECASASRAIGFRLIAARAGIHAGVVAVLSGDDARAWSRLDDALQVAVEVGETQSVDDALKAIAVLAARGGAAESAVRLWAAADRDAR